MEKFNPDLFLPHLSIDCVIFGYQEKKLKVLVSKFKYGSNLWGLPGGYIKFSESTDDAAVRILKERTGIHQVYLNQFQVFGEKNRIVLSESSKNLKAALESRYPEIFDQRSLDWITARFVCIGYYALVTIEHVKAHPGIFDEKIEWKEVEDLPSLNHDHLDIILSARESLRNDLDRKQLAFSLLPETFTMRELKELYEAIYEKDFAMNNFQKRILDLDVLERLGKKYTGAQNKAPFLYRLKN